MKYRAEIDGLRALAVVPVILFHAGFELFSGGFVGVDVFFVISGYLITTILIEDIEDKRFSIVNFYERRARRILPVLFFVMLVCTPFAWMWMLPNQIKDFSQCLVAVSLFVSNILFWRESGYFGAAAEEKPLLHTWSLAVEEQYYVLFPIFLILTWRFGRNRVFWMIFVMAAISLLLSEWGWRNKGTANFYLAPTRAWEIFFGSITAFIVQRNCVRKSNFLALLGLAAIVFSIFAYDESTPFPSLYALVPVLGAVLIILYSDKDTLAEKILSTKAFVGIGLISYSAYLWHQPLLAFARIKSMDEPSSTLMALLVLLSIGLAFLSWKFIENPFRNKGIISRKYIFLMSAIGITAFSAMGFIGNSVADNKMAALIKGLDVGKYGGDGYGWVDLVKEPELLLVGDSHAKQYIHELRRVNKKTSMYTESACLSLPQLINEYKQQNTTRTDCIELHEKYLHYIEDNSSIKTVIVSHSWGKLLFDLKENRVIGRADSSDEARFVFVNKLKALFERLSKKNIKIVVLGSVPSAYVASNEMKSGYVDCIYKYGLEKCPHYYDSDKRAGKKINEILSTITNDFDNIYFFDPAEQLCDGSKCWIVKNNSLIYSDHAHLTRFGANEVVNRLDANGLLK